MTEPPLMSEPEIRAARRGDLSEEMLTSSIVATNGEGFVGVAGLGVFGEAKFRRSVRVQSTATFEVEMYTAMVQPPADVELCMVPCLSSTRSPGL